MSTSVCIAIQTISILCSMIGSGRLVACEPVKEYISHTTEQQMMLDITGALSANIAYLIEGYLDPTNLEYVEPTTVIDLN